MLYIFAYSVCPPMGRDLESQYKESQSGKAWQGVRSSKVKW